MNKDTNDKSQNQECQQIVVNYGMVAKIVKRFGCSRMTIDFALTHKKNTPKHEAIRQYARQLISEYEQSLKED